MIIDTHAHVHPDAGGLGPKQDASVDSFLSALDASPLDKIVLLPIDPVIPNEFVQDVAAKRPDKIICFGSANPARGAAAIEDFEQLVASGNARGLKFHPRRQEFSMADIDTATELARVAAGVGMPVLVDCFPYGKGALRDDSLEIIEALSERVPNANIIIAHMGGIRILDALILARTSYTIFMDLSLTYAVYRGSHIEQDFFYAIRRLGMDRCLYGSDYPDTDLTGYYNDMREALDIHGFDAADQDKIFGENAKALLGVE